MTKEQKKMKRYMTAIERRLNLPLDVKARVMSDLSASVQARREAGQTDEQIYADLGTPKQVAAEWNEQMKDYAYVKSPWRWVGLAAAVLGGLLLVYDGVMGLLSWLLTASLNETQSMGIIGGADGPTAIFVTAAPAGVDEALVWAALLAAGLIAFRRLSRCKRK